MGSIENNKGINIKIVGASISEETRISRHNKKKGDKILFRKMERLIDY